MTLLRWIVAISDVLCGLFVLGYGAVGLTIRGIIGGSVLFAIGLGMILFDIHTIYVSGLSVVFICGAILMALAYAPDLKKKIVSKGLAAAAHALYALIAKEIKRELKGQNLNKFRIFVALAIASPVIITIVMVQLAGSSINPTTASIDRLRKMTCAQYGKLDQTGRDVIAKRLAEADDMNSAYSTYSSLSLMIDYHCKDTPDKPIDAPGHPLYEGGN